MAIEVKAKCSDCGTISDKSISATDTEIVCPECRRNMPNLSKEEFRAVSSTLSTQMIMGIVSLLCVVAAGVLLYLYAGEPKSWVSGAAKSDTSQFLYGAGGCILLACVFGALSARKRYVIEF